MSKAARNHLMGILTVVLGCTMIGWWYGSWVWGLLISLAVVVVWQISKLLRFESAVRKNNFEQFQFGDGIWEQLLSQFRFERERARRRKTDYRNLVREIRRSTDAMPDAAIVMNSQHEIVTFNRAAKKLIGLKRTKDRGQRVDNLLRAPKLTALFYGDDDSRTVEIPSPIADDVWLNCRVVPYGAQQQLLLLRDVTERRRLSKMRRDLVANASHELRSPLTVVSGYLEALSDDDELPNSWRKPVRQMRSQAERMNRMVSELMELSRLESSGRASVDEVIDIGKLLETARMDFDGAVRSVKVLAEVQSTVNLLGVQDEIESVIVNLLTNALRHSSDGGVVTLRWKATKEGAELSVIDTGEGIDAENIPRVTERFFRVDRGRDRADGGVGLGLAIVKHALLRHDARLLIVSEPGTGSEFCCVFPRMRIRAAADATLS